MTEPIRLRPGTRLAYGISALTTLLWFACVLPAGHLDAAAGLSEDFATPMHRSAWLLVPALLVLVIGPVGVVLSQGRTGRMAVLAATDAFLAGYAGIALLARLDLARVLDAVRRGAFAAWPVVEAGLIALLLVLATLSALELARVLRRGPDHPIPPLLRGLRLALCLFVLLIPAWMLFADGHDLLPLLIPFVVVGAGAAGPTFVQRPLGLRLTASVVHALLALYVLLVLRDSLFAAPPPFRTIGPIGWTTLGIAGLLTALALLQILRIAWRQRRLPRVEARVATVADA